MKKNFFNSSSSLDKFWLLAVLIYETGNFKFPVGNHCSWITVGHYDVLFCNMENIVLERTFITRRNILSTAHNIYDPIGFLYPETIRLKFLVQKSWSLKLDWGKNCPKDICSRKFENYVEDLPLFSEIRIPRFMHCNVSQVSPNLQAFCDASKFAYSAVVFLRSKYDGKVGLHFAFNSSQE